MTPPKIACRLEADAPAYWNCTPYAVTFSPDGERLAVGMGGYYGGGSITLHGLGDGSSATHVAEPRSGRRFGPTISGLCFDDSGEYLAASAWSGRHNAGPTRLYRIDGAQLRLVDSFDPVRRKGLTGGTCPTGVRIHAGQIFIRSGTTRLDDVVQRYPFSPSRSGSCVRPFASHHRLTVVDDMVLTGGGGTLRLGGTRRGGERYELHKACEGVVAYDLRTEITTEVPVPGIERVTAIVDLPSGGGFLIGGLDGELQRWTGSALAWDVARLADSTSSDSAGAFYRRNSIVGLCFVAPEHWFAVTAGGDLSEWVGPECRRQWSLAGPGSPRSIAVEPKRGLLAVAVKGGEKDEALIERGSVTVFAI